MNLLLRYLVTTMLYIPCKTAPMKYLLVGFLPLYGQCLLRKTSEKEGNIYLNQYLFSNMTLRGCGYLHIHVWLNNCLSLENYISTYSLFPEVILPDRIMEV